ncbi:trypsin-like peptidase domain-containing protein [Gammaproteobacteria bacterium]|nr:trypsin-like peptidase domain-containing protein [Gammaproteobacteria bacterium]MDC1423431.1 trypsin-like peptidase domain-containing protein [Gammaproteobacteria bacterium]MDC1512199.1 trypsin-like peptidase domain-containing protein [Gammaproteobacteria bacterium]
MKPSNRAQTIDRLATTLRFLAWPIACGLLLAIVIVQYNQLARLSRSSQPPPLAEALAAPSFADVIAHASPAVVSINATSVNVGSVERASPDKVNLYLEERASLGSGVIISADGYILTNLHVVDTLFDAFNAQVTLVDGRQTPATVVAWDEGSDLAVLHINMDGLTPIPRGDDSSLRVGDVVFAIGYPRNVGQSVSQGIVSALRRGADSTIERIQTDAAINPGNSGGALINSNGELVGLNSSILSKSGNFEGIGFATPASLAVNALEEMVAQAIEGNAGYLGVITGEALGPRSSELFFGIDSVRGMLVESVDDGGAAMRAGIQPGDVITRVQGTKVIDGGNIMAEVRNKKPGDNIEVEVYRQGQTLNLPTTLGFGQAIIIEP